jgi:hypothetical protein
MIQVLSPNNDAVFQNGDTTVQSWFEEHEDELQPLDLNITEPLWSVLETTLRNRFPLPTSLKQLEDVLREE